MTALLRPSWQQPGDKPWRLSADELLTAYGAGSLSPVEVLRSVEQRMNEVNPLVNAMAIWDGIGAEEAASASERRWSARRPLSPLDGVPVTIDDCIAVKNLPCRWGSALFDEAQTSASDDPSVQRLRQAGAVIIGKTNVSELSLLGGTHNALTGTTRHPWNLALTPGGPSGGAAAAVASGIGPLSLALDHCGAVRRSAGHTGLVGLKPGHRTPSSTIAARAGMPDLLPHMDTLGPLARTTSDALRLLRVIDPRLVPLARVPARLRIVYWRDTGDEPIDPEVRASVEAAVDALWVMGHEVVQASAPASVATFNTRAFRVLKATGIAALLEPMAARAGRQQVEAALTPALVRLWSEGRALSALALHEAQQRVRTLKDDIIGLFNDVDVVLTPANPGLPWPIDGPQGAAPASAAEGDGCLSPHDHADLTSWANACGLPAIALPGQPTSAGALPVGLHLVGKPGSENLLCGFGALWEKAQPWSHRWPTLSRTA